MGNNNKIEPIPELHKNIKKAVNDEKLAIFIGAGVSRLFGCYGWGELAHALINTCYEKKQINYKEKVKLKQIREHKKVITICYYILKNASFEKCFYQDIKKSLRYDEKIDAENIYKELFNLEGLFITTNADTHFDHFFNHNVIYKLENLKKDSIYKTNLYRIHGSINDEESLVFTLSQYMDRYNNPQFKSFLEKIFKDYTVLFVGYGLNEFEVLEFLLKTKENEKKHFILKPFFKGEDNILKFEESYYGDLGVSVLPYAIDENGYAQLYEVIKHWKNEINLSTNYLSKTTKEVEDAIYSFSIDKINPTLQKIRKDKALESFFFKALCESHKALNWLIPLKEESYFLPKKNPDPIEDPEKSGNFSIPLWKALEVILYIFKEINQLSDKEKNKHFEEVNNIVEEILNNKRIDNYDTGRIIINILSEFPINYINETHINFIKSCFETKFGTSTIEKSIGENLLPHLIKNKAENLTLNLLKIIFQPKEIKKENKLTGKMDDYYLEDAISKNKDGILKLCPKKATETILEIMKDILAKDKTQFCSILIRTIEDHEQKEFSDRYQYQFINFIRYMLEKTEPALIKKLVKELLESQHEIFRRIAFHLINFHYSKLNQIFWKLKESPLGKTNKHELYELLKDNASSLSEEQIKKVLDWIESYNLPITEPEDDELVAFYKKEWLLALLGSKNQTVQKLYNKYNEINKDIHPHPGFDTYFSVGWVKDTSPIEKNDFLDKSNQEKSEYIKSYQEPNGRHFDANHERKSLTYAIREFVTCSPENFTQDLDPFLDIQKKYQFEIIEGFKKAWENNTELEWNKIFDFIIKVISSNSFWTAENKNEQDQNRLCVSAISDLINEGTNSDNRAFFTEYLVDAEKIIITLFSKYKEEAVNRNDPVSFILNSGIGKLLMASVNISLQYARVHSTEDNKRWLSSIKSIFDDRLKHPIQAKSTIIVITMDLAIIEFLDSEWLKEKFNSIFNKDDDSQWELAMVSFLSRNLTLYEFAYNQLNQSGHYHKALKTDFSDHHIRINLIHHIGLGYFAGWDDTEYKDGLITALINNGSSDQLSDLIFFVIRFQKSREKQFQNKVRNLWRLIKERISINRNEFKSSISNIINWVDLFDSLDDEILDLAKFSVPHLLKTKAGFSFLFNGLNKLASISPTNTGKLLLKITNEGNYFEYHREEIKGTISALYEAGESESANIICNSYLTKGYDFLIDIYDQYNN